MSLSPETKKYLKYGVVAVVGVGGAIFLYLKLQQSGQASTDAAANAQAQSQAESDENQEAELATLGTSGASLSSVSGGTEIPVESFSDTLDTLLQAAGLSTGNTASPVSSQSTAPSTTGTPVASPSVPGNVNNTVGSTNTIVQPTPSQPSSTAIISPAKFIASVAPTAIDIASAAI
jgi:hypothetical protein